jgi:hypothetical protein
MQRTNVAPLGRLKCLWKRPQLSDLPSALVPGIYIVGWNTPHRGIGVLLRSQRMKQSLALTLRSSLSAILNLEEGSKNRIYPMGLFGRPS